LGRIGRFGSKVWGGKEKAQVGRGGRCTGKTASSSEVTHLGGKCFWGVNLGGGGLEAVVASAAFPSGERGTTSPPRNGFPF